MSGREWQAKSPSALISRLQMPFTANGREIQAALSPDSLAAEAVARNSPNVRNIPPEARSSLHTGSVGETVQFTPSPVIVSASAAPTDRPSHASGRRRQPVSHPKRLRRPRARRPRGRDRLTALQSVCGFDRWKDAPLTWSQMCQRIRMRTADVQQQFHVASRHPATPGGIADGAPRRRRAGPHVSTLGLRDVSVRLADWLVPARRGRLRPSRAARRTAACRTASTSTFASAGGALTSPVRHVVHAVGRRVLERQPGRPPLGPDLERHHRQHELHPGAGRHAFGRTR